MKIVRGTVDGHSADMYICVGFVPDEIFLRVYDSSNYETALWHRNASESATGFYGFWQDADDEQTALTATDGITIYEGGDRITTSSEAYKWADGSGDTSADKKGDITSFTVTTSASYQGKFNTALDSSKTNAVALGSIVTIDGKEYKITALTDTGESDDEVTLDRLPNQNNVMEITHITGPYTHIAVPANFITPAGFCVQTGILNTDADWIFFTATKY
ncbi:MAG: hypothetical protein GY853_13335 [PVC group bacterium]|nr:hypothetical protein [PVC group bacterium]